MSNAELAYRILYKEDPEPIPDPNLPENIAYFNALREKAHVDMLQLFKGPGRPIFTLWQEKLRKLNLLLFSLAPEVLDNCQASHIIREMQTILRLWLEVEYILTPNEPKGED